MFSSALFIMLEKSNLFSLEWINELLCKLILMSFYSFIYLTGFKNELRQQNACSDIKQIRKEEKQNEKNKDNRSIQKLLIKWLMFTHAILYQSYEVCMNLVLFS